ncbi:MAG: hypothetical protein EH225_00075 [Calditrichaeota bacterium]|nr:hypothetical protein [Calditrichota bacterium]RQW08649.1 MAG: hypothetical protein EH225_00075 [Calditrichota bacterium]
MKKSILFFLVVFIGIYGCEKNNSLVSPVNDNGMLMLKIDRVNIPASVVLIEATLTRDGYQPVVSQMNILNDSTAELSINNVPVGEWHLKVEAKNQANDVEYSGETEVTVVENIITEVTLALYPVPGGMGSIHLYVTWGDEQPVFLIMDEDAIDNGIHFNNTGGPITPDGPHFFTETDVNDDIASETQRNVLRYFASNSGRTITLKSGQTGDEGWFAPNCIPAKWISSFNFDDNTCLMDPERQMAIRNYFGFNGPASIPSQERLDKIPDVRPLRALGLNRLIGKVVYAVVYDSDISINYDHNTPLGVNGNLQGETLGIVAFRVNEVRTLDGFSSSTLPEVQITILDVSLFANANFMLLSAPIPMSSSVPNDRIAPGSTNGYYSLGN